MVGASGALFGLAAAQVVAEVRLETRRGRQILRGLGLALALLVLNLLVWLLQGGQLAWETHLGGFLAGLALSLALRDHDGTR
jgi:membrane associated rhomboid family serine protease